MGQARPEFPQDRIDMLDHDLCLSDEIVNVQRVASRRLVNLPAHEGHFTCPHAMLEGKVLIPVPVTLWPSVAAVRHRVPLGGDDVISC